MDYILQIASTKYQHVFFKCLPLLSPCCLRQHSREGVCEREKDRDRDRDRHRELEKQNRNRDRGS